MTDVNAGGWSGRKVAEARAWMARQIEEAERAGQPLECGQCGQEVRVGDAFAVGHVIDRWQRPDLTWEPSNWRVEHKRCSDASGQRAVIAKAKRDALDGAGFPGQPGPGQSPPLTFSPTEVRPGLSWPEFVQAAPDWISPLLEVPADASPPLYISPLPSDAVCSYGWDGCEHMPKGLVPAVPWIEDTQKITLRWWQRLAIVLQLVHRADGSLCYREIVETAPRRAGKSWRLRGVTLWRMEHGPALFSEPQTIVHTGSDVAICRQIQKAAWRWATSEGWTVRKSNGKEAIATPTEDEWLVRSQDAVYGYDVCLGLVDEGWDVKPDTVSEGLEPATIGRSSPQVHLTSTAHRRATSLMRSHIVSALTTDDASVLLLMWAAPHDADPSDVEAWRAASPYWDEERLAYIQRKYDRALAGEVDPEADDLDPMEGFKAQYLNIWRLRTPSARQKGEQVVTEAAWAALTAPAPVDVPDAAAIESWFDQGVTLALAWADPTATGMGAVVSASDHPDLASAKAALVESGFKGITLVGKSLAEHPSLRGVRTRAMQARTVVAVQDLARMLTDGTLRHDGGEHLAGQVTGLRTLPGADGPRMSSQGRADAVKAATWAASAAASSPRRKAAIPSRYQTA